MKIYSMTATFGKLEHQTLDLQDGLNVIEAPNEWGKSTWCAFLVAMFYGISTSSRTKKDFLADKERYAPWSGRPMAGRVELNWQGRDITIERSPKGKIPFGNFRAYETQTNLEIPELTGDNCGQMLLGVEREVFTRAGFLRGSDLPVVEGDALRRRLNALVTTGDENNASDALAQKLRDLKNSCRHNKTGRIPQAEGQKRQLQDKLDQLRFLKEQSQALQQKEAAQVQYEAQLENHRIALAYARSLETQAHMDRANTALQEAEQARQTLDEQCKDLPTVQSAQQELQRLQQVQQQLLLLQEQKSKLPAPPQKPEAPTAFAGKDPQQALQQANGDGSAYKMLCKPVMPILPILGGVLLLAAIVFLFLGSVIATNWIFSLTFLALSALVWLAYSHNRKANRRDRAAITGIYGNEQPDSWVAQAQAYAENVKAYEAAMQDYRSKADRLDTQLTTLQQTMELLTQGKPLADSLGAYQQVLQLRQAQQEAAERCRQAYTHAQTVSALVQTAPPPEQPDTLTLSQAQTEQAIQRTRLEKQQLHQQLARCQAQMEALGDRSVLEQQLAQVNEQLAKLTDMYAALSLAQDTLTRAAAELQRRFAPRISARARELFGALTGDRYDRLLLASDLSMEVAAIDEDTPHGVLWRSDGTVDQLYLALRLAVAEELTPDAPLVLDDALVRFDDTRLKAALRLLEAESQHKQVILFSCQSREAKLL